MKLKIEAKSIPVQVNEGAKIAPTLGPRDLRYTPHDKTYNNKKRKKGTKTHKKINKKQTDQKKAKNLCAKHRERKKNGNKKLCIPPLLHTYISSNVP